jgi:hypothetical protein
MPSGACWGIEVNRLLWLVPILLSLHNLEEALTMLWWTHRVSYWPFANLGQFYAALALVTLVSFILTAFAVRGGKGSLPLYLLYGVQAIVLINALTHLAGVIYFRKYVPGLVTAVFINIPFSLDLFGRGLHEGYITRRGLLYTMLGGVLVYLLIFSGIVILK